MDYWFKYCFGLSIRKWVKLNISIGLLSVFFGLNVTVELELVADLFVHINAHLPLHLNKSKGLKKSKKGLQCLFHKMYNTVYV